MGSTVDREGSSTLTESFHWSERMIDRPTDLLPVDAALVGIQSDVRAHFGWALDADTSSAEALLATVEESFVEATGVAPPGQRLRGHRQLPVHDLPWSRSMAPSTDSGTGASGATMRSGSGPGSARTSVGGRCR